MIDGKIESSAGTMKKKKMAYEQEQMNFDAVVGQGEEEQSDWSGDDGEDESSPTTARNKHKKNTKKDDAMVDGALP